MDNFKEFRREKRVTKKIKFKADVIKPKGEDAKTMDKVCQVLVAEEGKKEKSHQLLYNKHTHLDLSNIKEL